MKKSDIRKSAAAKAPIRSSTFALRLFGKLNRTNAEPQTAPPKNSLSSHTATQ